MNCLYIVKVKEDNEEFEYEYGNIKHATEHYDWETKAKKVEIIEYNLITKTEKIIRSK